MAKSLVGIFFCLAAAISGPARAEDAGPLRAELGGVLSRVEELDAAMKAGPAGVPEKALSLAASVAGLRAAAAREKRESMFPERCLRQVEIEAWELSQAAAPAQAAQRERLRGAMNLCTPFVTDARAPVGERALDEMLAAASASADRAESALGKRELSCADGFKVDGLMRSVAGGDFTRAELNHLRPVLSPLIMQYYHLDAFARRDPAKCDLVDKVEEQFSEGWGCHQLYENLAFHYEYMTRGPKLAETCQAMVRDTYRELSASSRDAVCRIVVENAGKPKELCAQLTPRYLSGYKTESCVDDFTLLSVDNDATCAATENGRRSWNERCREYASFKRAYRARDPRLCGDLEVCWALMGSWDGPMFKGYARRIQHAFCTAMTGYAHEEIAAAAALLGRSTEASSPATAVPSKSGAVSALQSRVSALSRRDALASEAD